jgi:predicted DNA-binding transcriptional regulator YafY
VSIVRIRERQAEIIRILHGRKTETVPRLALELGVSKNTIYRDISQLSIDYPLTTQQGNCGGVTLADWHQPYKNLFSREEQQVITELLAVADKRQAKVLKGLLTTYGTSTSA